VQDVRMPCSPQRVWEAVRAARTDATAGNGAAGGSGRAGKEAGA
jgi:carbon-monoxide dehydrogenase large subunit